MKIIRDIKDIIVSHKKSPMEFSRNDSLIICNENYNMKTISSNLIRGYIQKAKLFIKNISTIVGKDEYIFR